MSLPNDALDTVAVAGGFLVPDDIGRPNRLIDFELGGIALGDGSQGLEVQTWRCRVDGDDVLISPSPYTVETVVISEPGIRDISLAFDQSMRPTLAYIVDATCKLYWYDSVDAIQKTTTQAAGVYSPFLSLDDKRDVSTALATNDILFFYIRANQLCYRQQRDRFDTERVLYTFPGPGVSIKRAGMNDALRFQIEVTGIDAS